MVLGRHEGVMSKFCFPNGKGRQTCYKAEDYFKLGRDAPSWEEEHKVVLVTDKEYQAKPKRS